MRYKRKSYANAFIVNSYTSELQALVIYHNIQKVLYSLINYFLNKGKTTKQDSTRPHLQHVTVGAQDGDVEVGVALLILFP